MAKSKGDIDLFGKPIKQATPAAVDPAKADEPQAANQDLGLSLNDDEYLAFEEAHEEWVREKAEERQKATQG